jgi:hypothetical protein
MQQKPGFLPLPAIKLELFKDVVIASEAKQSSAKSLFHIAGLLRSLTLPRNDVRPELTLPRNDVQLELPHSV